MTQIEFSSSNRMFVSVLKTIKEQGGDETASWPSILENDLDKIRKTDAFDLNDPKQLQQKVFFYIHLYFARRGRENDRSLKTNAFIFRKDDTELEYCVLKYFEKTKNHQVSSASQTKARMYATGEKNCPVLTLKLYISKLSSDTDIFYRHPKSSKLPEKGYTNKQMGVNALGIMMKNISKRLNLSQIYTNHSIRATVVTLLASKGFHPHQIMRVTNHKCERSLRSYVKDNTVAQKRHISEQ